MSAFAEQCRAEALRHVRLANAYRVAGVAELNARHRAVAIDLMDAANGIDIVGRMEAGAARS